MGWAGTEFETIDLGDERCNKRPTRLVERLNAQPMTSVPQACGDWADTMAAYRFFDNEAVDWRAILGAHTDCAKTRMAGQASCIVAREIEPPQGEKPIEWRLLTNLPVASLEQAARLIDWYRTRWEIEMFFHVLKNGCRIEALQL